MIYTATCFSGSEELGVGSSTTKRSAETQAAIAALRFLAGN
jgi:dsRNA-specific ribonuclease